MATMDLNLERFRGGDRLDAGSLRGAVIDVMRGDVALSSRSEREFLDAVDALLAVGIGMSPVLSSYGQGLTLLAGTLLRIAGANVEAIRTEVAQRDDHALAALISALVTRLRGAARPAEPARPPLAPPPITPSSDSSHSWTREVNHSTDLRRQDLSPSSSVLGRGSEGSVEGPHAVSNGENVALSYLRSLMSDELARAIGGYASPSGASSVRTPAVSAWVHVEVAPGIALQVSAEVAASLAAADARRDVLAKLDAALARLLGTLRPT